MAKIPIKIPRGKGPTGPSNQAAARNRKKWKQQIARDYPIVDKKSGKRFKTAEAARQYSATRTEIKSGQIKVKEATRSQERSNITQTLKTNNMKLRQNNLLESYYMMELGKIIKQENYNFLVIHVLN